MIGFNDLGSLYPDLAAEWSKTNHYAADEITVGSSKKAEWISGQMGSRLENQEGGAVMKCMKCGKEAFKSTTTEAIELGFGVLVIRNIPCYKCVECDDIFYTGDVAQKIEEITERVKQFIQEVTVVDFEKAA